MKIYLQPPYYDLQRELEDEVTAYMTTKIEGQEGIDHPPHYVEDRVYEPADVIVDWDLPYCLGNVVKYISRAGRKSTPLRDLKKAQWYLNYWINRMESGNVK